MPFKFPWSLAPSGPFRQDTLLVWIGLCAMFLAPLLWLTQRLRCGTASPAESVSQYYHLAPHAVFVGALLIVSALLLAYEGWSDHPSWKDRIPAYLGSFAAAVVALVPTLSQHLGQSEPTCHAFTEALADFRLLNFVPDRLPFAPSLTPHFIAALTLFACLAYMCLFRFQIDRGTPEERSLQGWKQVRNGVYVLCGLVMLVPGLSYFAATYWWKRAYCPESMKCSLPLDAGVFWVEAFALFAFGVAWLVRSRKVLGYTLQDPERDKRQPWRLLRAIGAWWGGLWRFGAAS